MSTYPPMPYRSMSFHRMDDGPPLDADLVALGAQIGFNDVTFQMGGMQGGVLERCAWLRKVYDQFGYRELCTGNRLTISAWMYELNSCGADEFGPFAAGNDRLFREIGERYRRGLGGIFPELDHVVLSVSESKFWVGQDPAMMARLIGTIHEACAGLGKKLIVKTFAWHPEQAAGIVAAARQMPPGVIIQTKCVPQDWNPRNIHDPFIGIFPDHEQFLEVDAFGENAGMHFVANCRLSEMKRQFDHWRSRGVQGISVRVSRRVARDPGDPDQTWYDSILGNAQEANLWFLGAAASGGSDDPELALRRYTAHRFGDGLAEPMARVLRHTGEVVAEAQCVDCYTFGRQHPLRGITNGYAAIPTQHGSVSVTPQGERIDTSEDSIRTGDHRSRLAHLRVAERYEDADDLLNRNPFHLNWSAHRWDRSYEPLYRKLRRGDPEVIAAKADGYRRWLACADESLAALADLEGRLPEEAHAFVQWKLQENRYYLIVRSELALAWLKAERRLYTDSAAERGRLLPEIEQHLSRILACHHAHGHESYHGRWLGRERRFIRGAYFKAASCVAEFRRFWGLEQIPATSTPGEHAPGLAPSGS